MESTATFDSNVLAMKDDVALELPSLPELLESSSSYPVPPSTFAQPEFSAYLSQLTDLPLAELAVEPTTLSSSAAQLTNALTTLCHTSYPTFLSLHATTSTLSSSLTSLSSSLDGLLSALPALEDSARSFAQETREIQKERRKASLVLEQHDKLHDVLSLPMLLDSCVRNHNYNEALLLANHASSLAQRFPANPLIQSVKGECDARVQAMLAQLLSMLREQAKLPALFRAVNFLRKMDVLDEQELALAFLTGRVAYLAGALHAVDVERQALAGDRDRDKETYARFLKRHVDVWREGVYDVVTQYTTIFLERAPAPGAPAAPPPAQLQMLLRMFTTEQLQALLKLLRATLPHIPDPALLNSLLTQLTYCANSFARVGLDFKPLLAPIFVDAVRTAVTQELGDAAAAWSAKFVALKDRIGPAATPKRPAQLLVAASAASAPPLPTPAQLDSLRSGPPHVPPQILASYPLLAIYTNALLSALNGLRLLAPVELYRDLLVALDGTLATGAAALLGYARDKPWLGGKPPASEAQAEEDAKVLRAVGTVYFDVFAPFVVRALSEGVYGRPVGSVVGEKVADVRKEWDELFPAEAQES
ncbi:Dor1-domain-containing protein [Phanerochaete sordida]|uniref:Conserved oligomeric Golgi complex subunit 8 n=1 Tax=Phanerochaete sordida TaxID=48140 RepID=A0A9P3GQY0_9APHY|nr:Dor1-domain-containing protein [Phanerochaete sordida]